MHFLRLGLCAFLTAASGLSLPAVADSTMPTCGAGDSVVWENTSTKVYHAQGDRYFGKTKSGQYACKSDADKAGYHLSKSKSKGGATAAGASDASSMASASPEDDATPVASPAPGKHHRHKKGVSASPAPGESPAAMMSPSSDASPSAKHHHRRKKGTPSPAPSAT